MAGDAYWNNVVLAMHMDGAERTFAGAMTDGAANAVIYDNLTPV